MNPKQSETSVLRTSGRTFTPEEVMRQFGFKNRHAFFSWVVKSGCPYVRLSPRKAIFLERDIEAFLSARTMGAPIRRPVVETAAMNYAAGRGVEHREAA